MRQVDQHVREMHNVDTPTETIMSFLATTVRDDAR